MFLKPDLTRRTIQRTPRRLPGKILIDCLFAVCGPDRKTLYMYLGIFSAKCFQILKTEVILQNEETIFGYFKILKK